MSRQSIEQNGAPAFVVIPRHEWQRTEEIPEDRADTAAVRDFPDNPSGTLRVDENMLECQEDADNGLAPLQFTLNHDPQSSLGLPAPCGVRQSVHLQIEVKDTAP